MTLAIPTPKHKSAFRLRMEASMDEMPCTHRCICGYSVTGPTGQAREKMRAHRIAAHPERPAIAKRPKKPKPPKPVQPPTPPPAVAVSKPNGRPKITNGRIYTSRIDKDELHRLYVDEGLSIRVCADTLGVAHSTIRYAIARHDIPRRAYTPRDQSYVNGAREAVAWRLYEQGYTGQEIAEVAADLWGYGTVTQCRRSLYEQFARHGRKLRPAWKRLERPTFDRAAALELLKGAEANA